MRATARTGSVGALADSPDHPGAGELRGAQRSGTILKRGLGQDGLRVAGNLRRDEIDAALGRPGSVGVEQLHALAYPEVPGMLDGDIDVQFEVAGAVHGGEQRSWA